MATHRLYVGNLSFQTRSEDLQDYFSEFGKVESATVIMERDDPGTPRCNSALCALYCCSGVSSESGRGPLSRTEPHVDP